MLLVGLLLVIQACLEASGLCRFMARTFKTLTSRDSVHMQVLFNELFSEAGILST